MRPRSVRDIIADPFARCDRLSDFERQAANLVAKGYTVRDISVRMSCSENAARMRLRTAMLKLGCSRKHQITRLFVAELEGRG